MDIICHYVKRNVYEKSMLRRFSAILLIAVLCASLAGCGKKTYEEGYEAGFAAGKEAAEEIVAVVEATQAEDLEATEMKPYFYPEVDKSELFDKGYIAAKSGHSRGSTVDLTIVDMITGREVDMGGGFDYFGELSHPDYTKT